MNFCADTQTDPANCGACGTACGAGRTCVMGMCACAAGQTTCGTGMAATCTNTASDNNNCGMCGRACAGGQTCTMGMCACPMGQTSCGTGAAATCVDTTSSAANCGACGTACPMGQVCSMGMCRVDCTMPAGLTACGTGATMTCANLQTSEANCGMCGNACATGSSCTMGVCACPAGQLACGMGAAARCINVASDATNCGACGNSCVGRPNTMTGTCDSGACILVCNPGTANCDNDPTNGCEVILNANNQNCGSCGNDCDSTGTTCQNQGGFGVCGCSGANNAVCASPTGPTCTNTRLDRNNCGGCGIVCDASTTCQNVGGVGVCRCATPSATAITCGTGAAARCVNPQTDPLNCGRANLSATCGTATTLGGPNPNICFNANGANGGTQGQSCRVVAPATTGSCACAAGRTFCPTGNPNNNQCYDLDNDPRNCGACGMVCGAATPFCSRVAGVVACRPTCAAPATQCNMVAGAPVSLPVSCVDTRTNDTHCGGCSTALDNTANDRRCATGGTCVTVGGAGQCQCTVAQPTRCNNLPGTTANQANGFCTNNTNDPDNCGGCGRSCPAAGTNNYPTIANLTTPIPAALPTGTMLRNNPGARNCTGSACVCGTMPVITGNGYTAVTGTLVTPAGAVPGAAAPPSNALFPANTYCTDTRLDPNHCGGAALTTGNNDCRTNGVCSNGRCAPPTCRDILLSWQAYYGVTPPDGVYRLDPDGAGGVAAYSAFCVMGNMGGAALVAKISGLSNQFVYGSTRWTDQTAAGDLNPASNDLTSTEARLPAARLMAFGSSIVGGSARAIFIRMTEEAPTPRTTVGELRQTTSVGTQGVTFLQAANATPVNLAGGQAGARVGAIGGNQLTIGASAAQWRALFAGPAPSNASLQANCNVQGFNVRTNSNNNAQYRFGIWTNNETDCNSSDSGFGIGGVSNSSTTANSQASNNYATCCGGAGSTTNPDPRQIRGFAMVFVR